MRRINRLRMRLTISTRVGLPDVRELVQRDGRWYRVIRREWPKFDETDEPIVTLFCVDTGKR